MKENRLPVFTLRNGNHRIEIFDPREDPMFLGARYVHGGYISAWFYDNRCLTGRPNEQWNPRQGEGLPEVFEYGLGWSDAGEGEDFLRIGAGRLRKDGDHWMQMDGKPSGKVEWTVAELTQDSIVMRCRDGAAIGKADYAYELERRVAVHTDGLESRTRLFIKCPWSHPVFWFAHPFFAHQDGAGTSLRIPESADPSPGLHTPAAGDAPTHLTTSKSGGFGPITRLWGWPHPIEVELDMRLGGGTVSMEVNKPLDKLVVYATPRVFSVEPYIARAWHNEEEAEWGIRYRFTA